MVSRRRLEVLVEGCDWRRMAGGSLNELSEEFGWCLQLVQLEEKGTAEAQCPGKVLEDYLCHLRIVSNVQNEDDRKLELTEPSP
jgi:hypothetical protein